MPTDVDRLPAALACDVLVLGAGPAGATLATLLARAGFAVTLADRKRFPRSKPCGEFLSPECRPYLRDVGVDDRLLQRGTRLVHGMQLHRGQRRATGSFVQLHGAHQQAGYAVRRELLDFELLQAAIRHGARWLERHDAIKLLRDAAGTVSGAVLLDRDRQPVHVTADCVVAADGVHSRMARTLGLQRPLRWLDKIALIGRFHGVAPASTAEVHFVERGYFAAVTVDDGAFHCNLIVDRQDLRAFQGDLDEFVATRLQAAPVLRQRLAGAQRTAPWRGTGPLAFTTTRQVVPGAVLCGDACGYVDPLTGEGIYFALHGARSLAQALITARAHPARRAAALRAYGDSRRHEVSPRAALAALLQRGLRRPWLADVIMQLLAKRPRLCDLLVTLTGDAVHPRDLLRPAFWRQWSAATR